MFSHSTTAASLFSVLAAALICSLSLRGVATAQSNTSLGAGALANNTTGSFNTASGLGSLFSNTEGSSNTATGVGAFFSNTTAGNNTATGHDAHHGRRQHRQRSQCAL
jgi:hypothetical protein